jgi:hypothetical protein
MKSRYTNCNQAKLGTICNNPTGFLTLEAQLLGNGFKEILFSKFLTKCKKLSKTFAARRW